MTPASMRGGWAGEIGQTQFLPTPYVKYAGRLRRQRPRRPHPQRARRARLDSEFPEGPRLAARPALHAGTANYQVLKDWNRAEVYQRTISVMASKLAGH